MGMLSNILEKLGLGKADAGAASRGNPSAPPKPNTPPLSKPASSSRPGTPPQPEVRPSSTPGTNPASPSGTRPDPATLTPPPRPAEPSSNAPAAAPRDKSIPVVDVVAQLEKRAAANPQKLNWRTSIVDLLKLLDMDSSLEARKELAKELNCPQELMGNSADMNIWLHKTVLARIAENGGNVPAELTD